MEDQTTQESGANVADSQNTNAVETPVELSEADLAQRFLQEAEAQSGTERSPKRQAKPQEAPAQNDAGLETVEPDPEAQSTETQAEAEEDGIDPEDKDALSKSTVSEHAKKEIHGRIGKYATQAKEAKAQAATAKAEAEQAKAQVLALQQEFQRRMAAGQQASPDQQPVASKNGDLSANIQDEAGLTKLEGDVKKAIRDYENNIRKINQAERDGQTHIDIDGQQIEIDTLERAWQLARDHRDEFIPARRKQLGEFSTKRQEAASKAQTEWPEMYRENTPERNLALYFANNYPGISSLPDAPALIGTLVEGYKAIQARKAQSGKSASAAPAKQTATSRAPNLGDGGAAPSRVSRPAGSSGNQRVAGDAMNRLKSTGSVADLTELLKHRN